MERKIKTNNYIIRDYKKLVAEISEISGISFHIASIFEKYLKSFDRVQLKKLNINFLGGKHFTYRSPYNAELIFGGSYVWALKNNTKRIEVNKSKTNNYLVAIAYEFFESFLRSITARLIVLNPFVTNYDPNLGFRSYDSCLLFLQHYKYRDNMKVFKFLQEINPKFKHNSTLHRGMRNYFNFFSTYKKCWNHIIHTDGYISLSSYSKFGHLNERFARDWFGVKKIGRKSKNKYMINTSETSSEIFETIIELAYLIVTSFDQSLISKLNKKKQ